MTFSLSQLIGRGGEGKSRVLALSTGENDGSIVNKHLHPEIHIVPPITIRVKATPCPVGFFWKTGDSHMDCRGCPVGATCDGSDMVVCHRNFLQI